MTTQQRIHMFTAQKTGYRAVRYFPVCEMLYGVPERKCEAEEKAMGLLEYFTRRAR